MNHRKRTVVVGLLGPTLDQGKGANRWDRWRPSVALCQHEDLLVDRLVLLSQRRFAALARTVTEDIQRVSPETEVVLREIDFEDAWDLEEVYGALLDFARAYPWDLEREDYLVHITTGTHIAQISLFLLAEAHHLPGRLLQTSPPRPAEGTTAGTFTIIDLDLSKYDRLAARFRREQKEGLSFLKSGIDTRNPAFNRLIERIEHVAIRSRDPLLLTGPTGAGKSQLARRIHELKRSRHQVTGEFVEVNCATLRGDGAMSALFGHHKGAFTGALADRPGLLRKADQGILVLDEIGELGRDEQAMLLRAIEEKAFFPLGSDKEVRSDFQLIAGTNRDLRRDVELGRFREDLLARIDLWSFKLPGLRERPEDVAPNLEYELDRHAQATGEAVAFNREARERFLAFATARDTRWPRNFRDFNAALRRMATLASGGRVTRELVDEEVARLREAWREEGDAGGLVEETLGARAAEVDPFDRVQLEEVLRVCRGARSLSEAGRALFAVSRTRKSSTNDADRLRKYLARYRLAWKDVWAESSA
ncbi:MAG: sigma 54-interacting transcriptional regulator [Deltaproteobacteria bacterium]|nr:sigma 54-interacting transcriptional regulator [Deltaproteobacteria bacterium]